MTTHHCPRCHREWRNVPPHVLVIFHNCQGPPTNRRRYGYTSREEVLLDHRRTLWADHSTNPEHAAHTPPPQGDEEE